MTSRETERKIGKVKPSTLANLVVQRLGSGRYRIPQFQWELVSSKSKEAGAESDSMLSGVLRFGSVFLWAGPAGTQPSFPAIGGPRHSPVGEYDDVSFILDGQQRITDDFTSHSRA